LRWPDEFIDKIIYGDHLIVLKDVPDNVIDLTVTSPPYGEIRDYKGFVFDYKKLIKELFRITKVGGVLVWVVGDQVIDGSESGVSFEQALFAKSVGFNIHDTMIYSKDGAVYVERTRYWQEFEYMFIFSKSKPNTVNLIKDKKSIYSRGDSSTTYRQKDGTVKRGGGFTGKRIEYGIRSNVWRINSGYMKSTTDKIAYYHPAIFPDKLARDHIISWSNKDDIVLDPMCGSGTTCKMAKKLGRKYIGIDISPEYCNLSKKRVNMVTPPLF